MALSTEEEKECNVASGLPEPKDRADAIGTNAAVADTPPPERIEEFGFLFAAEKEVSDGTISSELNMRGLMVN